MDQPPGPGYYRATDGKWYPAQPPPIQQPPPQVIVQQKKGGSSTIIGCAAFVAIAIVVVILIVSAGSSTKTPTAAPGTTLSGAALDAVLAKTQPLVVDEMVKSPEAFRGGVFEMYLDVAQFDTATGACLFLARWDAVPHERSFEYKGDNALFTGAGSGCPVLAGIDEMDQVKVWARGSGARTYEARIGGELTVPSFEVLKAEVKEKK